MSTQLVPIPAPNLHPLNGLNPRQNSFVNYYLELEGNGLQAAKLAGYAGSDEVLAIVASKLLRSVKVREEVQRRLGNHIASANEVLERLTHQARADLGKVLEPDGTLNFHAAKLRGQTKLLKKVKYDKDTGKLTEIELYDAQAALEKLGKFHGLFVERSESLNINIDLNRNDISAILQQSLADID